MAFTSGLNTDAVRTAIDDYLKTEMQKPPLDTEGDVTDSLLFAQRQTTNEAYIFDELSGPGYFQTRAERQNMPEGTPRLTRQKTLAINNKSLSVPISKNFVDDQKFDLIRQTASITLNNARQTRKRDGFAIYNNAFTTELANDGVALASNSHTTVSGRTVDNLITGTLTLANLETAFNALLAQPNQDGVVVGFKPGALVIPIALIKESKELLDSELIPNSGNNAVNFVSRVFPFLQMRYSPFLSAAEGGSDTAWFVTAQEHQATLRVFRSEIDSGLQDWVNSLNNDYIYKWEYRDVYGSGTFLGFHGSDGTV